MKFDIRRSSLAPFSLTLSYAGTTYCSFPRRYARHTNKDGSRGGFLSLHAAVRFHRCTMDRVRKGLTRHIWHPRRCIDSAALEVIAEQVQDIEATLGCRVTVSWSTPPLTVVNFGASVAVDTTIQHRAVVNFWRYFRRMVGATSAPAGARGRPVGGIESQPLTYKSSSKLEDPLESGVVVATIYWLTRVTSYGGKKRS